MTKTELYRSLGMDKFFLGDSFEVNLRNQNIITDSDIHNLLDNICVNESRKPLNGKWRKLPFDECSELLLNAFNFDLAYTSVKNMSKEEAEYFQTKLLEGINPNECRCFTNWFQNPWNSRIGAYWNPITDNTFDMAIVVADSQKLLFTYFVSED